MTALHERIERMSVLMNSSFLSGHRKKDLRNQKIVQRPENENQPALFSIEKTFLITQS